MLRTYTWTNNSHTLIMKVHYSTWSWASTLEPFLCHEFACARVGAQRLWQQTWKHAHEIILYHVLPSMTIPDSREKNTVVGKNMRPAWSACLALISACQVLLKESTSQIESTSQMDHRILDELNWLAAKFK